MRSELILPLVSWGLLGGVLLLILQRLIAQLFPRPPENVFFRTYKAQQPPSEAEGDGMAAVYALDTSLMEAELERPGSTFWIYYRQPMAVFARWIGSLLISFPVVAWIIDIGPLTCGSILLLFLGLAISIYPYQAWWMSRPKLRM
jgi:hypothetical protein